LIPGSVGPVLVVVLLVGGQDLLGVGLVHDEDVAEGLASDAADHSLAVGGHPGSWWSAFEDLHPLDFEDGVEGRTLLAVAVAKLPGQGAQVAGSSRRSFMHVHIVGE
jgi:hypothetical protein